MNFYLTYNWKIVSCFYFWVKTYFKIFMMNVWRMFSLGRPKYFCAWPKFLYLYKNGRIDNKTIESPTPIPTQGSGWWNSISPSFYFKSWFAGYMRLQIVLFVCSVLCYFFGFPLVFCCFWSEYKNIKTYSCMCPDPASRMHSDWIGCLDILLYCCVMSVWAFNANNYWVFFYLWFFFFCYFILVFLVCVALIFFLRLY